MAVVSSVTVASDGSFVFAVGSSNRFSSCRANPSNTGPLCWVGDLGATNDVSSLKESSTGDYYWAGCGSLEQQSGTRFALPARHRKSLLYSCRLGAHLCSFGSRLRLRNSHVSAEQSATRVKRLPTTYCLKCLIAHRTAMPSRSVGPRADFVFEKWWLSKVRTSSSCPTGCRSTAPTPVELPSVCTIKVLFQSGSASTAGEVEAFFGE